MTELPGPFAHVIEPNSLDLLEEEVTPEVWEKHRSVFEFLASKPHPAGGGASYYAVFHDPNNRNAIDLIHADQLYARYETDYYNEEIHLISPKK